MFPKKAGPCGWAHTTAKSSPALSLKNAMRHGTSENATVTVTNTIPVINSRYRAELENAGLKVSGINPERNLVEIVELPEHPYFIACQFHPEFKSRPQQAHPLFSGLIEAALKGAEHAETH